MEATEIYAIAAGGIFVLLILVKVLLCFSHLTTTISVFISRHLTYPYLINRHCLFGPWTRFSVLSHFLYVAVNIFCLCFPKLLASDAGQRAGVLALINMVFLFAGVHLSFVADLLGISLRKYQALHRASGWMVTGLSVLHTVVMVDQATYSLDGARNLFAIIVRPQEHTDR